MTSKRNDNRAVAKIAASIAAKRLIVVIGTGVSLNLTNNSLPALSWRGLIEDGFVHAEERGLISAAQNAAWNPQINSPDLDDMISAADFVSRKLSNSSDGLYARWLESCFSEAVPKNDHLSAALKALHDLDVQFCTLNYDTLLEQVLGCQSIDMSDVRDVTSWVRRENNGVLHLHGVWRKPETCILGSRDYESTLNDSVRDLVQRSISAFGHLLFIGCGGTFSDPNFSSLIRWLKGNLKGSAPEHFALVRSTEVAAKRADRAWQGYVEPLSFGENHSDLPGFINGIVRHKPAASKSLIEKSSADFSSSIVMDCYRQFLLRDCGQMTIEGMRADLQTAQRRFDLEHLFVPLDILPPQPEFPDGDPDRESKLLRWMEKNREPKPFGAEFVENKRLVLLALPGGGKTLLLKRLAVAYADPKRRDKSDDNLPDLDLLPIVIKCREWRDHIRNPIIEIIERIPMITGQRDLAGLREAITERLTSGRLLLLIDGLDEIHNDADRTTFVENLDSFVQQYPDIRLVATSREAGFNLVAPNLLRYCTPFRVAPLSAAAIKLLCRHWHNLMSGGLPEGEAEADQLSTLLISTPSLMRLAENPLLLTMLLVVKHGAGRLPPDRVSLYDRAVDVLLDTWNIKGHQPLNPREAVPQLACIAFELMKQGKQTATQEELLRILERARDKLPQIKRYATDTPDAFLKRVELRSSLLVEAGHKVDGIKTVPFYQFRHLTFQEYLAAVAASDGHHLEYRKDETVLTPLSPYLLAEEWKEVIPMAAVLAQKQAEPLVAAVVREADKLVSALMNSEDFIGQEEWNSRGKLPGPISLLTQSLIEEAEAAPETLAAAIHQISLFAKGCRSAENWEALARGPYAAELIQHCWASYRTMEWPRETWLRNTLASMCAFRQPTAYWLSDAGQSELAQSVQSSDCEISGLALLTCCGIFWTTGNSLRARSQSIRFSPELVGAIKSRVFDEMLCLNHAATWAFGLAKRNDINITTDSRLLDNIVGRWVDAISSQDTRDLTAFTLRSAVPRSRSAWNPTLTNAGREKVRESLESSNSDVVTAYRATGIVVAYFAKDIVSDETLSKIISSSAINSNIPDFIRNELSPDGRPKRRRPA